MNADNADLKRAFSEACSAVLMFVVLIRVNPRLSAASVWWSELESSQPLFLFRESLILLSYPTRGIADCRSPIADLTMLCDARFWQHESTQNTSQVRKGGLPLLPGLTQQAVGASRPSQPER